MMRGVVAIACVLACGACEKKNGKVEHEPKNQAKPRPTTVALKNGRSDPIYVEIQDSCYSTPVVMLDGSGSAISWAEQANSCDAVRAGDCADFGACQGPGVFKLGPGEKVATTWDGTRVVHRTVSDPGEGCSSACVDYEPVKPGKYVLEAKAWSGCEGEGCDCQGVEAGQRCDKPTALQSAPDLDAKKPLDVPGPGQVELVFD